MRKTHSKQESEVENINLTPLIDTVFILLIFFLVTSSFTKESGIDVDRPTAKSAVREEQGSMIIAVNKEGEVWIENNKIELTFTEFQILHLLASHPGWVFTRYQMIDKIRGENYPVIDRSVDFQIVGLRKKMGKSGNLIETIRGVGYRFKSDD